MISVGLLYISNVGLLKVWHLCLLCPIYQTEWLLKLYRVVYKWWIQVGFKYCSIAMEGLKGGPILEFELKFFENSRSGVSFSEAWASEILTWANFKMLRMAPLPHQDYFQLVSHDLKIEIFSTLNLFNLLSRSHTTHLCMTTCDWKYRKLFSLIEWNQSDLLASNFNHE